LPHLISYKHGINVIIRSNSRHTIIIYKKYMQFNFQFHKTNKTIENPEPMSSNFKLLKKVIMKKYESETLTNSMFKPYKFYSTDII